MSSRRPRDPEQEIICSISAHAQPASQSCSPMRLQHQRPQPALTPSGIVPLCRQGHARDDMKILQRWTCQSMPFSFFSAVSVLAGIPADAIRSDKAATLSNCSNNAHCGYESSGNAPTQHQRCALDDAVWPGLLRLPGCPGWQTPAVPLLLVSLLHSLQTLRASCPPFLEGYWMHVICGDSIASFYEVLGLSLERHKGRISLWAGYNDHCAR